MKHKFAFVTSTLLHDLKASLLPYVRLILTKGSGAGVAAGHIATCVHNVRLSQLLSLGNGVNDACFYPAVSQASKTPRSICSPNK